MCSQTRPLLLASSSVARRALLARLGLAFEWWAPNIDERRRGAESAEALARRLALEKAQAGARAHPDALIIASDQVARLNDKIIGKPGHFDRAAAQLSEASGQWMSFYTALALRAPDRPSIALDCIVTRVKFRRLSAAMIARYLERETPYECAGGFRAEGLGIALFERLCAEDPSALIGLPLIALTHRLAECGIEVLDPRPNRPGGSGEPVSPA